MVQTTNGLFTLVVRPSPRRPHYALHPVRPSVFLSVRMSVPCPPLIRKEKTVQRSNSEMLSTSRVTGRSTLRSKGQRSRSLEVKCENHLAHIFAKTCIDSRKAKTTMTPHSTLHVSSNMMRQRKCVFFEITGRVTCADVLFQVNGTSAQCCVAVKQTWREGPYIVSLFCDTAEPLVQLCYAFS